jgi:hypothetical protein
MKQMTGDEGLAVLSAVMTLALFGLIGIYLSLSATTEVRISDNYEALIQARYAALAGAAHTRDLLRGLDFDDLLNGPDGTHSSAVDYLASARTYGFRNPFPWSLARFVECSSPAADVAGLPDDGLINTGAYSGAPGTALIPATGVPFCGAAANPRAVARYFVKASDNSGEAGEIAADPSDDPFHDGDGVLLVRSMGIASTFLEHTGTAVRRNAVSVFETRYKRRNTFQLGAPLVILGDSVSPASGALFEGNGFRLRGSATGPGLAVIDPDTSNANSPVQQIRAALTADQTGAITGDGAPPSVRDVTSEVASEAEKARLLDPAYLGNFASRTAVRFADTIFEGDQIWGVTPAGLGVYDPDMPAKAPGQWPQVTVVLGSLEVTGDVSGGGLLVILGRLRVSGTFRFNGLILVVGTGELDLRPTNLTVTGAVFLAAVAPDTIPPALGMPRLTLGGNAVLQMNPGAVQTAVRLIPPDQTGFREVASVLDPNP